MSSHFADRLEQLGNSKQYNHCHHSFLTAADVSQEMHLCFRILHFTQVYTPINRSRLVSLLSEGSSAMRRIANIVAYGIITDTQSVEKVRLCIPNLGNSL